MTARTSFDGRLRALEKRFAALEERLVDLDIRLGRAERLGYASYTDVRDVARHAHETRLFLFENPEDLHELPDEDVREIVRKLPRMEQLQDMDALKAGMSVEELAALKLSPRVIASQCRHDALDVACLMAAMIQEAIASGTSEKRDEKAA